MTRILIAEDQPDMNRILKNFLIAEGYEVSIASNGIEAVAYFESDDNIPDLVLMDIMMPELSGIEATRLIRQKQLQKYVPIIFVTAKRETEDIVAGLKAGGDDYITKPFSFDELIARIGSVLRVKKVQDRLHEKTKEIQEANEKINKLNIQLLEQNRDNRKRIYQQHNLFRISNDLHSQLEMDQLIHLSLLTYLGQFRCKSALLLLDTKKDEKYVRFEVQETAGYFPEDVNNFLIQADNKFINYMLEKGRPDLIDNIIEDLGEIPELRTLQEWGQTIIAPLIRHNAINGLVFIGGRVAGSQVYSESELEMLAILNNMLIIAIHNAELYNQVIQISYTDGMTGLHNFRYFEYRLIEEISRSNRNNSHLSLIILDVDFFKNYNDTLGHPAGDELLRQLAGILKETVRDNDIVCRYGGEEFAVILPNVDKEGAKILAERLRYNVEQYKFPREEVQPKGTLTISLGLSEIPSDADKKDDLIKHADSALYHAKKSGRNKVALFSEKITSQH
jgi:two-component system cell cycle response regulator